ncbi:hypothetical protein [Burkholderia gladioli]|uniref:hypothetical protein n=2 Tax=Burkholderia gladioli TaxID=28095 RepID=UPI001ABAD70E|nr:hypothetical protein [Burkholderia gladioli]
MKKAQEKLVSPSEFMRQLRPERYSDSTTRDLYRLKPEILSYHLDSITERNETHDFELFCRKLCERTICPNLRAATGPEGGGDSKADTETTPVADEIGKLYCGLANSGSERWAFAFSAKKTWADKARSDVAGIIDTKRGYKKVFFVTSRAARAKDRARVEQELSEKYGVTVTIHDRSWIVDEVINNNRRDLAYNYLGIGDKVSERELGPSDYSRKQQLEDIEKELTDPTAFAGMKMQRAAEALVAAKLARELELPRTDVDGKFSRAIRLADDGGTQRQQFTARYEAQWTAFWWFDDIKAVVDGYDAFEALVIDDAHAKNLEMLCNLTQLLFNIVVHGHLSEEQAGLKPRIARLSSRLSDLASDPSRPNNALEARTSLLTIEANEAMRDGDSERLASLWPQFSDVLVKAEGMGEFDVNRLTKLVEVLGVAAGKSHGYRDLVDQVSEFVAKRTGESEGARVLLKRAHQLDFDENMEMIRLLGKAARLLTKKEHADDLVSAHAQLSLAYRSAGLLWAARASCTAAATTLFIEGEEEGELSSTIFPLLMNAAWQAVELKHLPEVLQIIQIARGCLSSLPYDEASIKRAGEQLHDFDLILACQLANLSTVDVPRLDMIPDTLGALGLFQSRATLLYVLGYEDVLREEGWIPDAESAQDVVTFFNRLAGQPAGDAMWRPAIFNGKDQQMFVTSVLGVRITVTHQPSDTAISVAEAIVGTVEAFFATAFEVNAFAHAECFDVYVVEANITRFEVRTDIDCMKITMRWPQGVFPGSPSVYGDFLNMLLEVAATIFSATCHAKNLKDAVYQLFRVDGAMDRAAMIGSLCISRQRIFKGVARFAARDTHSSKKFEARPNRPLIVRERSTLKEGKKEDVASEDFHFSKMTDHRDVKVHSVIDVHLWNRAEWMGAAYGVTYPQAPPFMALVFRNREAASKIFERWRERLGLADVEEEIHIGIVRRFSDKHPTHYGMVITSEPPRDLHDSRVAMMASRTLTMEPSNDVNLSAFLDLYKKAGAYRLMPMLLAPDQTLQTIDGLSILKRTLHVKIAADVGPNDPENSFLAPRGLQGGRM